MESLLQAARAVLGEFVLRDRFAVGSVAAALRTRSGAVFTGICMDFASGIGFCAEHAAVAEMLKHREVEIQAIVAVGDTGVIAPCGRCRELLLQLSTFNAQTLVALPGGEQRTLAELLPDHWLANFDE